MNEPASSTFDEIELTVSLDYHAKILVSLTEVAMARGVDSTLLDQIDARLERIQELHGKLDTRGK